MAARLGNVLYWAFSGIAAILAALFVYVYFYGVHDRTIILGFLGTFAVVSWLIGRAVRYVLADR